MTRMSQRTPYGKECTSNAVSTQRVISTPQSTWGWFNNKEFGFLLQLRVYRIFVMLFDFSNYDCAFNLAASL